MSDLILISENKKVIERVRRLSSTFNINFDLTSFERIFSLSPKSYRLAIVDVNSVNDNEALEYLQVSKQIFSPDVLCAVVDMNKKNDVIKTFEKHGADFLITFGDFLDTSIIDYLATQSIEMMYIPVKPQELIQDAPLDFNIHHLISYKSKFVVANCQGEKLSQKKIKHINDLGEVYIHRKEYSKFQKFLQDNMPKSEQGLKVKLRHQFVALQATYTEMSLNLYKNNFSYENGRRLISECYRLAGELIQSLAYFGNPKEIINNASIFNFGSTERTPAIATYVAIQGILNELPNLEDLMIGTLFSDIGLLKMPLNITDSIRNRKLENLDSSENEFFLRHPKLGLNQILHHKIDLSPVSREVILNSHTKYRENENLSIGAQLCNLATSLDYRTTLRKNSFRPDFEFAKSDLLKELKSGDFSQEAISIFKNS